MAHRRWQTLSLWLLCALASAPVWAGDLTALEVSHSGNRYRITASFVVDAPLEAVRRLLTDYDNLAALSPSIIESELVSAPAPGRARVRTRVRACVLIHCRVLQRMEDVRAGPARLIAVIVPQHSDFDAGRTEWRLEAQGEGVRVEYRATLEPAFDLFPVVGPALMKAGLERELRAFLEQLQRRAEAM